MVLVSSCSWILHYWKILENHTKLRNVRELKKEKLERQRSYVCSRQCFFSRAVNYFLVAFSSPLLNFCCFFGCTSFSSSCYRSLFCLYLLFVSLLLFVCVFLASVFLTLRRPLALLALNKENFAGVDERTEFIFYTSQVNMMDCDVRYRAARDVTISNSRLSS